MREIRETLQMQFTRLQKDLSAARESGPKLSELNQKIAQSDADKQNLMQKIKDALAEKLSYQLKMQEQEEKVKALIVENKGFKERIFDTDAVLKRQQSTISDLNRVQQANSELKESIRLHQESIASLRQQLANKQSENQT